MAHGTSRRRVAGLSGEVQVLWGGAPESVQGIPFATMDNAGAGSFGWAGWGRGKPVHKDNVRIDRHAIIFARRMTDKTVVPLSS